MNPPSTLNIKALAVGLVAMLGVVLAVVIGSHGFAHFDAALTG